MIAGNARKDALRWLILLFAIILLVANQSVMFFQSQQHPPPETLDEIHKRLESYDRADQERMNRLEADIQDCRRLLDDRP